MRHGISVNLNVSDRIAETFRAHGGVGHDRFAGLHGAVHALGVLFCFCSLVNKISNGCADASDSSGECELRSNCCYKVSSHASKTGGKTLNAVSKSFHYAGARFSSASLLL